VSEATSAGPRTVAAAAGNETNNKRTTRRIDRA
jgi:hypothetical protein